MHSSITDRFWSKVDKSGGPDACWLWTAAFSTIGYGHFRIDGKTEKAHRVSWRLCHDEIPIELCVLHRCDVRACVNPAHLFLGTYADNAADMTEKSRHGRMRLDAAKVIQIREMRAQNGATHAAIARQFGVTRQVIGNVIGGRRKTWTHL